MLTEGHYFFTDIQKEGIHLYVRKSKFDLRAVKVLTPEERKRIAEEDFEQWFKSAKSFYTAYKHMFDDGEYKTAAFLLHQATERFYGAVTLVFVNYRYRTHDIKLLGKKAVSYNAEFVKAFPRKTQKERDNFKLLERAYVDARYKKEYKITKEQLEYLAKCVRRLKRLTKKICKEKIESFV